MSAEKRRAWTLAEISTDIPDESEALTVRKECERALVGKHPGVQGVVLAELVAMWLAGHPPEVREKLLELHLEAVKSDIAKWAAVVRGEGETRQ